MQKGEAVGGFSLFDLTTYIHKFTTLQLITRLQKTSPSFFLFPLTNHNSSENFPQMSFYKLPKYSFSSGTIEKNNKDLQIKVK